MTHLDPSSLARYNSLTDPNLQSYFSSDRIRSHLKHAGLITGQGEIIPDGEYRTRLARREHRRHVRNMLAENIVNRAIDMERTRHAEMKRQYDLVAKAALVNNIKESRRRSGQCSVPLTGSNDMALLSIDSCWAQMRPHSANQRNNEISIDQFPISRVKSAHAESDDYQRKSSSKSRTRRRRRRSRLRSKSPSASTKNLHSSASAQIPCEIRMIYYGPKMKIDYDHLVFEPVDEVVIMQQHCGGESIIVYKDHLKPGAEFTFQSRRHLDFPFGLTLYVKGYIDSRISTCCEYKHRHGVRLGGERGHFAIISVKGSKPCVKCRFEKQARMNKYAQTAKDKDDKNPIIIPVPITDEPKEKQEPVIIPVRSTSNTHKNYVDDFDGSDRQKRSARDGSSTDSSIKRPNREERKSTAAPPQVTKRKSAIARKEVSRRSSTTSEDHTVREEIKKKTWQIVFHASNAPNARNLVLKFSLLSNDEEKQTGIHEINMTQFNKHFKSDKQYSFPVQFEDIGQPEQIRLKMERIKKKNDDDDDDEDEDENIQWQLDHIELIDPESQSHSIFSCRQLIKLSSEKILRLSSKTSRSKPKPRRSSSSSDSSPKPPPKVIGKMQKSSSSSSSSSTPKQSPTKPTVARVMSPSAQSDRSTKSSHSTERENLVRYRVTIYPSYEPDGNFEPTRNSRIYLRVNSETKSTDLPGKTCPTFEAGEKQTFELDLRQTNQEKPKKLTIGYVNQNEQASTWKLNKIVLVDIKTGVETIFPCREALQRDASNYRAEKTFENHSSDDDQSTPRNEEINTPKSNHFEQPRSVERLIQRKPTKLTDEEDEEEQQSNRKSQLSAGRTTTDVETPKENQRKSPSIHSASEDVTPKTTHTNRKSQPSADRTTTDVETPKENQRKSPSIHSASEDATPKTPHTNVKIKERSSSFESMNDDNADYRRIFKKLDPNDELELGSPRTSPTPPRPRTRRGRDEPNTQSPVAPLIGLEGLGDHSARSDRQKNPISSTSTLTNTTENQSRRILSTNRHDGDAEDN